MKVKWINRKDIIIKLTVILGLFTTTYLILFRLGYIMSPSQFSSVVCVNCSDPESIHPTLGGDSLLNYEQPLANLVDPQTNQDKKISILIEKSKYRLTVFEDMKPIKSYPVVFGINPTGDKLREGDRKTPEGIFYVKDLYPHQNWSKFIWLDYPRPQSWRQHFQAKLNGELNWLMPIGGEIGIHGVPNNNDGLIDRRSNWTLGCISLKNDDVDEIYQFIGNGTLVEIVPD